MPDALGLLEVKGWSASMVALDAAEKAGDVHVRGDQFPKAPHTFLSRRDRCFHGGDVALDEDRHVSAAELFLADDFDVGGFDRRVDRLDNGGQSLRFDHADGVRGLFTHML